MFKGRQFDQSVILLCVRWYLHLEEMMAERGIAVDHTTIHRWTVRFAPLLLEHFNRRKRSVTGKWHVDETYKSAASGCIFTAPSTVSAIQSNSGSASSVTCLGQAVLQKSAGTSWPSRPRRHRW